MDALMSLGAEYPVVIFSKSYCGMCHTVKTLISNFGANPAMYELDLLPNGQQIESALLALGCQPSVPVVFIGKQLVGGTNEIMSLNLRGKLKPLLINAKAIWV